jgi:hypothetical protein
MARLTAYAISTLDSSDAATMFCADLDKFLDQLAEEDAFGTEAQNDPRGDQR